MIRRGAHREAIPHYSIAIEQGAGGVRGAWCLDFPGCYAQVPAGEDLESRMALAILEFLAWSHNRAAERLSVKPHELEVVQVVRTDANIAAGESRAFFIHDGESANPRDFPAWAGPHDQAFDELRDLVRNTPLAMHDMKLGPDGATLLDRLAHCTSEEAALAARLRPASSIEAGAGLPALLDAHSLLQQVVCDMPAGARTRQPGDSGQQGEEWSVRKVMRRSIWHLRYHTWEIRRAFAGLWLAR